jgi:competence protein ComEC
MPIGRGRAQQRDRWFLWAPVCLTAGIAGYFALPIEPHWLVFASRRGVLGSSAAAAAGRLQPLSLFLAARRGGRSARQAAHRDRPTSGASRHHRGGGTGRLGRKRRGARPGPPARSWCASTTWRGSGPRPRRRGCGSTSTAARAAAARPVHHSEGVAHAAARSGGARRLRLRPRLWFQGIGATGVRVRRARGRSRSLARCDWSARGAIEAVRGAIRDRMANACRTIWRALSAALIIGERSGIPRDAKRAADFGLAHILAISGLHMSLMAGSVFWLLRAGLALIPGLALNYPIKKWAACGTLVAGFGYLLISGWGVATQRAYVMLAVMCLAVLLDRPAFTMRNLALAGMSSCCCHARGGADRELPDVVPGGHGADRLL